MIVGLPGAGISAFFYLLCVLLMPVHAAWLVARRRPLPPGGWRLIARQWVIAAGIIAVLYLGGLFLGLFVQDHRPVSAAGTEPVDRVLARVGIWLALGTLALVLLVIQLLSLAERRRRRRHENRVQLGSLSGESLARTLIRPEEGI